MTEDHVKLRILLIGGFPAAQGRTIYGGQVAACTSLLESSFAERHAVITLDTTQISNPPPLFMIRLLLAGKRLVQLFAIMLFRRPDAVIIFLADGASALEKGVMARFAKLFGARVMVFPRAGGLIRQYFSRRWFANLMRHTIGKSDIFLCQGLSFHKFAVRELGFLPDSAPVIPNWTASRGHLRIGERRDYLQHKDWPQILFLGWLEEFKGVFELLEAVRLLRDGEIKFHVVLGGGGAAMSEAMNFVELHALREFVSFAGWVDEVEKVSFLEASQIFVLPSWSEGLPNAMIEAMSAGLACVVTKVGMIPDYAVHGRDALVVEPKDVVGVADALKTLICNRELRGSIAKNGFQLASSNFNLENGAELLSAAVENVCRGR